MRTAWAIYKRELIGSFCSPLAYAVLVSFLVFNGVVFYFFMIRPQQRKQKAEQKMRDSLAKGDRIVTIGGIHGKIVSVEDTTVMIEVDNGVKLKMEKVAVKPLVEADDKSAKKS